MRRVLAVFLALQIGVHPVFLYARQAGGVVEPPPSQPLQAPIPSSNQTASTTTPDVEAMGLSFDRIKRLLADRAPSANKSPLKLNYYVEVVALAPRLQLFTREDLAPRGAVSWGAPTHADILRVLSPGAEFRSPIVPIGSLAVLGILKLVEWEVEKAKRQKSEDERRKRDEEERKRQKALEESGLVIKKTAT